jgi:hypothetical protein
VSSSSFDLARRRLVFLVFVFVALAVTPFFQRASHPASVAMPGPWSITSRAHLGRYFSVHSCRHAAALSLDDVIPPVPPALPLALSCFHR